MDNARIYHYKCLIEGDEELSKRILDLPSYPPLTFLKSDLARTYLVYVKNLYVKLRLNTKGS